MLLTEMYISRLVISHELQTHSQWPTWHLYFDLWSGLKVNIGQDKTPGSSFYPDLQKPPP